MPYNNSGVFVPAVTFTDGTAATAEDQNTQDSDIAGGLTTVGWATGKANAPSNMNMGGFKLTNLAAGSSATDSVNYSQISSILPPGVMFPFAGSSVPSGFLLCDGQAVSRTTYANLFAAIGTAWGSGDGSTTFNVPDYRGYAMAGADNMGGTPANRLTGYALGSTGGAQAVTLAANQLPVTAYQDTGHSHPINDPGHLHAVANLNGNFYGPGAGSTGLAIITVTSGVNTATATTGISVNPGTANITNPGGGQSHSNVQPTATCNVIIKT